MNKFDEDDDVEIDSVISDEKEKEIVRISLQLSPDNKKSLQLSMKLEDLEMSEDLPNITSQIEEIQKNTWLGNIHSYF
jgi:hypothetical protein